MECTNVFIAEQEWNTLCICCWKESKDMDLLAGDKQVRLLQEVVERLETENRTIRQLVDRHNRRLEELKKITPQSGDLTGKLKDLLRLCHPDRHNNSETASTITRWLLEVREQARA